MCSRALRLIAAAACLALPVVFTSGAAAHAAYESSDPANGSTVSSPPSRVIAKFTEPIVDGSTLAVYDPCGEQVDNGDSLVATDRITVTMSGDHAGGYTVTFDVVSAVDSHNTQGSFTFTSSGGSPCPGEEPVEEEPQAPSGEGGGNAREPQGGPDSAASTDSGPATSDGSDSRENAGGRRVGTIDSSRERNLASGSSTSRRPTGSKQVARVANILGAPANDEEQESAWDGVPKGAFVAGLLLAALIGAAGGKVYAGIMGWTR